jgi:hypothetical protein
VLSLDGWLQRRQALQAPLEALYMQPWAVAGDGVLQELHLGAQEGKVVRSKHPLMHLM